jgi:hypothetical protein
MALKNTINSMNALLIELIKDLDKAEKGNKAASQRVRTSSIKLEKIAKLYRKESVKSEKSGKGKKKVVAKKKTVAKKKVVKKAPCKKAPCKKTKKKTR